MTELPRLIDVGIDIGGTFTDVVCRRAGAPALTTKIMSTRSDPSEAVLQAIRFMVEEWKIDPQEIGHFLHGTTVATNAVLERKGAKVGLLTTEGFKDVLEIGRQMRQHLYGIILQPETPVFLAPGKFRKEIRERVSAQGEIIVPLDEASVLRACDDLVREGVQSIAVCFLFSFLEPAHERRTRELVRARYPDLTISISSEVDPAFREYERTAVVSFDAYIKPVIDRYIEHLENGLRRTHIPAPLQIMQSRGGLSSSAVARQRPVRLFMSGPAAGVIGGTIVGRMVGAQDVITIDIGGTSSDIALVNQGSPVISSEGRIDAYPVRVPMVDVNAIGAGGGSIAWIDQAGGLRVGPHSAGADPGPAAYGKGGEDATVTDASLVLGYLNPAYFAGGSVALDVSKACEVIEHRIARPLGMSVQEAALGIHRVINAQMVEGIRLVSIRQGFDPRRFTLVAMGGAGPVHATALAHDLGIRQIVIPRHPGVLSAAGLLAAPIEHEVAAAFPRKLEGLSLTEVRAALEELDARCARLMAHEAVRPDEVRVRYFVDIWYLGQSYHLEVPLVLDDPDPLGRLYRDFLATHDRIYGYATQAAAAIVNLRTIHAVGGAASLEDGLYEPQPGEAEKSSRPILIAGSRAPAMARVYARERLTPGMRFAGPAIVEQTDTTTLIEPGWQAEVAADGNLLLRPQAATGQEATEDKPVSPSTGNRGRDLDPITVEVVRNKLDGIANEMESTLIRSAYSTIVKEGLDASASLFTLEGETLAQAIAIPIHLATLISVVRTLLEAHPAGSMTEGDVFTLNDPYLGGTHLPDIAVMMPVFFRGRPIAISATMTHHQDLGGMAPGSTPTNATEIFQEGLRIPLLKLMEGGKWNETFVSLLKQNVRIPDIVMGDLVAEVSACSIGARRLKALAEAYGDHHMLAIFDELLDRSETMTRAALRSIPEGTYRYLDYLDNDGVDLDRAIPIQVAVTVKEGQIVCDFEGTGAQVRGPFNCVPSGSFAAACFAVRAVTDPDNSIPNNGGCFRAISLALPEGSMLNPREPAPVGCRTSTIKRVTSTILGALRQAVPDRMPADPGGEEVILHFGGHRADGSRYVTSQILIGGTGASHRSDGVDVIENDATNCMNIPAEAIEMDAPIRVHRASLAPGSGGAGTRRGGLGARLEYEILDGEVTITYRGERHFYPAAGTEGGRPGGPARAVIRRADGEEHVIPSKEVAVLRKGDRLIIETAGGGGFGDPKLRDRALVEADLANGKITLDEAREVYGMP